LIQSRSQMIDQMSIYLAGRAAEQIIFGDISSGAADDLRRTGEIARHMVIELGMGPSLGAQSFVREDNHPLSQQTLEQIDGEVAKLVAEAMERAHDLLRSRRGALDRLATALAERETLDADEIRNFIDA
ncbi:MAG: ATP-dependent zinc metalloprotease FtsH, partial [Actinomycetota bacterium]